MANNWKNTLLMPETDFEMKANLVTKEPEYQAFWLKNKIYQKALAQNQKNGQGTFILHDGPPYANGDIHVGHALNKILKDIIVRRKTMEGFFSPYVAGWDTHGLPIENKMLNEMGMSKDDLDQLALRKAAKKYALKQIANQKNQFSKLQMFADMSETYQTFDYDFEVGQLKLFKKMALDKLIYKGLKPVYWSPSSQSALAEAEVEYHDVRSPQIILGYVVKKGNDLIPSKTNLLVMTTTPWTVIATSGIAIGPEFEYVLVKANGEKFVIAKALIESIQDLCQWENYQVLKTFSGTQLLDLTFISPVNQLECPIVKGHHVTTDMGTGLVQMAPLFGEDDYLIGKENKLAMIMHVDNKGIINKDGLKYEGLFYGDASKAVGEDLKSQGKLFSLKFVKHAYPHDWRTHKPIIYRGVPQWFVNIEPIKKQILKELQKINSVPSWGVERLQEMIANRTEWTISRQRTWGVPIIIFYDQEQNPIFNAEIFDYVIDLVAKEGTDVWWSKTTDQLLPPQYRNQNWTREMDIMDVWFDSGSSSIAVKPSDQKAPFDLYLEGSDQYRGWFNSSLINSVAYRQKAPFKTLISHGFVLDGKQQKMSKSKGNVVDPLVLINKHGADILRLWVANSEYTGDISISELIIKQNIEIYRRLRNTFRFILGNLQDFDVTKDQVKLQDMHQYIHTLTNNYAYKINQFYNQYKFLEVVKEINKWFIDLSGWYFDYAKDILYCDQANSDERRSVQTNLYAILQVAMLALAPILPTTMEEVYRFAKFKNPKKSVFLEKVSLTQKLAVFEQKQLNFEQIYRPQAYKTLEEARKEGLIKRNNEAILIVDIPEKDRFVDLPTLAKYLMVAQVEYGNSWKVKTFTSAKCQRCWNHFSHTELNQDDICKRCAKVVATL